MASIAAGFSAAAANAVAAPSANANPTRTGDRVAMAQKLNHASRYSVLLPEALRLKPS
jgi:hypothetical protein